jgi:DNA-binding response OmpR family regulator
MPATHVLEADSVLAVRPATPLPSASTRDLVLLVEDDEPIAGLLAHILERMNWRVAVASTGAECLRLLETHREEIGLAFLDCSLPDLHGGSLCARLRATVPGLPVLLTSGRTQPGLLELVAADGPAVFLSKPFLPADVMRQVRILLPARAA